MIDSVLLSVLATCFTVLTGLITGLIMLLFSSHSKRIEAIERNFVPRHEHQVSLASMNDVLTMIQGFVRDIDIKVTDLTRHDRNF